MSDSGLAPKMKVDGRHELVERLEDRGAGEVWKARDPDFKTRVSMLKVLAPLADGATSAPPALQDTVKRLRTIRHAALLPAVGVGMSGARPYVAYAWFEGPSLAAASRADDGLTLVALSKVFDAVCEVVHACHAASLTHGRINPGCVLVQPDAGGAEVRLTDVGLAPWTDQGAGQLYAECVAPEAPEARAVDPAQDVFGIGATLRRVLAVPDNAPSWVAPFGRFKGREDAPKAVWEVIARATKPSPGERFESVAALREALQRAWRDDARLPVLREESSEASRDEAPLDAASARQAPAMLWDAPQAPSAPPAPSLDEQKTTFKLSKLTGAPASATPAAPLSLDNLLGDAKPFTPKAPAAPEASVSKEPNPWSTDVMRREVAMPSTAAKEQNPWATDVLRREVSLSDVGDLDGPTTQARSGPAPTDTAAIPLSLDGLLAGSSASGAPPYASPDRAPQPSAPPHAALAQPTQVVSSVELRTALASGQHASSPASANAAPKRSGLWIALVALGLLVVVAVALAVR